MLAQGMTENGDSVCCAFSGGADSTALILVLNELSERLGITLSAVHINHMLRGRESNRDESFCAAFCERLGIPLKIYRQDAAEFSRSLGVSVETGAREMRYKIFSEIIDGGAASKIATAHNLNDNAETVIFRLARGTGLKGLCGIPAIRGNFIRPLLSRSRAEVEEFLAEREQDFVTDSTNLSDDYVRNKIRHNILPLLSEIHGGFPRNIPALSESLSEDEDFLAAEAEKHIDSDLRTLHPAIRKRIIINFLESHNIEVSSKRVEEINSALLSTDGVRKNINSDGNRLISAKNGRISVSEPQTASGTIDFLKIEKDGSYPFSCDRIVIISKVINEKMNDNANVNKKLTNHLADYDKIQGGVLLRNRQRGDRIKLPDSPHTKELRKILQECLPPEERAVSAVLADENGVFWSECAGIAQRVRPDENTRTFLEIQVKRLPKGTAE